MTSTLVSLIRKITISLGVLGVCGTAWAANLHFVISPDQVIGFISPYIYGLNAQDPLDTNATIRRLGGNRMTGYNWVNNASNAGTDYKNSSDDWICQQLLHCAHSDQPAQALLYFVEKNKEAQMESVVTLPMAGYVAADKNGEVLASETAPSSRWKRVEYLKKQPYTLYPNPQSPIVYEDELVHYLVHQFHSAAQGGIPFYELDNEPALWPETHPRIHPQPPTYQELIRQSQSLAGSVLKVDPAAKILGPVAYGWSGFLNLQNAPDSAPLNQHFGTFLDFYLDQMHEDEEKTHQRLLYALDIHWYPEAMGDGKRITENDISPASMEARMQAPRSLWDPTYMEKSWIADTWHKPIQLIPWLQEKIAKDYPGTQIAMTEYDYGAGDNISGGIAQADVLGILGQNHVFMSNYWGDLKPYNVAAFKIYRNYDGQDSTFGDTSITAQSEDVSQASIYAAIDSHRPNLLWILVLNKSLTHSIQGEFKIDGLHVYKTYASYGFNSQSPALHQLHPGTFHQNQLEYGLSPLSATLFVCQ